MAENDKPLVVHLEKVSKVSIHNITRVTAYSLSNEGDFVIHKIEFQGGGNAILGYSKTGKLMRFETNDIAIRISNGTHVTLDVEEQ